MLFLFDARQSLSTEGKAIIRNFLVLLTIAFGISYSLSASISTDSIPYGITYPTGTFNQDDTVTFKIWAGNQSEPLSSIVGFDITFTLTEDAVFPSSLTPDFTNSWIADGDEMSVTVELDSEEKTIRIIGQRTSGSRDGHEEILAFSLVSASNQVSADLLLNGGGSGIIITIEDVILRKSAPNLSEPVNINLYPNPTPGKLIVSSTDNDIVSIEIIDGFGKLIIQTSETAINLSQLGISKGRYWVKVISDQGSIIYKPIIYSP